MKKRIVLFLFCFLLIQAVHAGWDEQTSGTTQTLNSIFFPTTAIGYAAGAAGTVVKTGDGGLNWSPLSSGTTQTINAVMFPVAAEGYFVGTNGVVLKTTDGGASFTQVPSLPSANYKKAAYSGTNRAIAGNMGASAAGYLVTSADSGANWAAATVPDFAIEGVYLTSGVTWMWGQYISSGQNSIVKRTATDDVVWQSTTHAVSDIYFSSSTVAYAVGSGGLFLKTTDGGSNWTDIPTVTTEDLNAVVFANENIGWIMGENGTALFTIDGGANFSAYSLSAPLTDVKDIMLRVVASRYVHAWICGSDGKIYELVSPTITAVSPTAANQGKIGTIEVTGSGFATGAEVSFSTDDIAVSSTTFYTATRLVADFIVSPEASLGARDVIVTNPDATTTEEVNAFSVNANTAQVVFRKKKFDTNAYVSPEADWVFTITPQPLVSYEVYSPAGLTTGTLNARVFINYTDANNEEVYIFVTIPASAMTVIDASTIGINYSVPNSFPSGEVVAFSLYAEDLAGNVGQENLLVAVSQPQTEGDPSFNPPTPDGAYDRSKPTAVVNPEKHILDLEHEDVNLQMILTPGTEVSNFTITVLDKFGTLIVSKKYIDGVSVNGVRKKQVVTAHGVVTKFDFTIYRNEIMPYLGEGIYIIRVINDDDGSLLARNLLMVAPSSMQTQ
jgi:photosystem II stability/assembly factor-like uncharacterized protein